MVLFVEANHLRCIMVLIKLSWFHKSVWIKRILSINQSTNSVVFVDAVMITNYVYGNAIPTVLPPRAGDCFWGDWFIASRLSKDNAYFNAALLFVRFGSYVTAFVNLLDLLGFLRNKIMYSFCSSTVHKIFLIHCQGLTREVLNEAIAL